MSHFYCCHRRSDHGRRWSSADQSHALGICAITCSTASQLMLRQLIHWPSAALVTVSLTIHVTVTPIFQFTACHPSWSIPGGMDFVVGGQTTDVVGAMVVRYRIVSVSWVSAPYVTIGKGWPYVSLNKHFVTWYRPSSRIIGGHTSHSDRISAYEYSVLRV